MTIILDHYTMPETGRLEIHTTVEIQISAEQARKQVDRWLLEQVSSSFGSDVPVLVVGKQVVWRVPVRIGLSQRGSFVLGNVEVDAQTGQMASSAQVQHDLQQAASDLLQRLPRYQTRRAAEQYTVPSPALMPESMPFPTN